MQKYQQVAALFLKSTTEATQAITKANLDASRL